ncbi:hypothetical protein SDC9_174837 [bioreactor metagenome]|uniref:Uncharacterized protein n=1 Tax=bioreactor metagenome TaxID=1076179 RepID=A0A645GL12_9ZZZZ
MVGYRYAHFGHLHQRHDAFLHSGSTGSCEDDDRQAFFGRTFEYLRNLLTDNFPNTCHDEIGIHHAQSDPFLIDGSRSGNDSLIQTCSPFGILQFFIIIRKI